MTTVDVTPRAALKACSSIQIHSGWEAPWNETKVPNRDLVQAVVDLGVGHVRDSLWVRDTGQQLWHATLAEAGVKLYLNLVDQRRAYVADDIAYLATRPYAHAVAYLAGHNEPNAGGSSTWPRRCVEQQQELYQAAARAFPNVPIAGPAIKHEHVHNYDADLRACAEAGVSEWVTEGCLDFHFYPGNGGPVLNEGERDRAAVGFNAPVGIHSETGWKDTDTDAAVKARYSVEAILRGYLSGLRLTSLYSLTDDTTGTFGVAGKLAGLALRHLLGEPDGGETFPGHLAHPSGVPSDTGTVVLSDGGGKFTVYLLRTNDQACTLNLPRSMTCNSGDMTVGELGRSRYTIRLTDTLTVARVVTTA